MAIISVLTGLAHDESILVGVKTFFAHLRNWNSRRTLISFRTRFRVLPDLTNVTLVTTFASVLDQVEHASRRAITTHHATKTV